MNDSPVLQLKVTPETLERFCRQVRDHSASSGHALAALVTLESFFAVGADPSVQSMPAYPSMRRILRQHAAEVRERLLHEHAALIRTALARRDAAGLARSHTSLSRSGFAEAVAIAIAGSSDRHQLEVWLENWLHDARRRGESASGFPDALDLEGADIDVREYVAMMDLTACLGLG